ncbi:Reticulon-like protein B12 [Linum perenne]
MGSSSNLASDRRTSLHQIFGRGLAVADVVLWRESNITIGILLVTIASWVVFEISGYTLISLVSSVLLLLLIILFLWAKSAAILNSRPPPPLPKLQLSEEVMNEAATLIRTHMNNWLAVSQNVALGKDTRLFFKVVGFLLLISIFGGWIDLLTLGYTSNTSIPSSIIGLLLVLTLPVLYERYGDGVDRYVKMVRYELQKLRCKIDVEVIGRVKKWVLEKQKLH